MPDEAREETARFVRSFVRPMALTASRCPSWRMRLKRSHAGAAWRRSRRRSSPSCCVGFLAGPVALHHVVSRRRKGVLRDWLPRRCRCASKRSRSGGPRGRGATGFGNGPCERPAARESESTDGEGHGLASGALLARHRWPCSAHGTQGRESESVTQPAPRFGRFAVPVHELTRTMRVLFVLKQIGYVRHFDTVIGEMADRGHVVRVACQDGRLGSAGGAGAASNRLGGGVPETAERRVGWGHQPGAPGERLCALSRTTVRRCAQAARESVREDGACAQRGPVAAAGGMERRAARAGEGDWRRLREVFALIERAIPSDPAIEAFIAQEAPDVVVITPLVDLGSAQTDLVKAAQRLHVPVAMALFSWDNLSTKGRIHVAPDRHSSRGNRLQQQEVVELHGLPDRSCADHGGAPIRQFSLRCGRCGDRAAFCQALGFDRPRPIVVYLGSSPFRVGGRTRVCRRTGSGRCAAPPTRRSAMRICSSSRIPTSTSSGRTHPSRRGLGGCRARARSRNRMPRRAWPCCDPSSPRPSCCTSALSHAHVAGRAQYECGARGPASSACRCSPARRRRGGWAAEHTALHYLLDRNGGLSGSRRSLRRHVASLRGCSTPTTTAARPSLHSGFPQTPRHREATPVFVREVERLAQQGSADGVERETQAEKAKRQGSPSLPAKDLWAARAGV